MNEGKPTDDTLRDQLGHLNERSRWYSTQLWQIPFAYLGITGVALASFDKPSRETLMVASFAAGVFGGLVVLHSYWIKRGEALAIRKLRATEEKLGLSAQERAEDFSWDVISMMIITIAATLFYFGLGIYAGFWMSSLISSTAP